MKLYEKILIGFTLLGAVLQFFPLTDQTFLFVSYPMLLLAASYIFAGFWMFNSKEKYGRRFRFASILGGIILGFGIVPIPNLTRLKTAEANKYFLVAIGLFVLALGLYLFLIKGKMGKERMVLKLILLRGFVIASVLGILFLSPISFKPYRWVMKGYNVAYPRLVANLEMFDHRQAYEEAMEDGDCGTAVLEAEKARIAGLQWLGKTTEDEESTIRTLHMAKGFQEGTDSSQAQIRSLLSGLNLGGDLHAMSGVYDIVYYSHNCRADNFIADGMYPEALEDVISADRALQVVDRTSDYWKKEEALLEAKRGKVLAQMGYVDSASTYFLGALEMYAKVVDSLDVNYARIIRDMATAGAQEHYYTQAIQLHRMAISILKDLGTVEANEELVLNTEQVIKDFLLTDSIEQAHKMLDFAEEHIEEGSYQWCNSNLLRGFTYVAESEYLKGRDAFLSSLRCYEITDGEKGKRAAQSYIALANVDIAIARWSDADQEIRRGMDIIKSIYGENSGKLKPFLKQLAHLRREQGSYQEALDLYTEAEMRYVEAGTWEGQYKPGIYGGLSQVHLTIGNYSKAVDYAVKGFELVDPSMPGSTPMLNVLGNALSSVGEYSIADTLYAHVVRKNAQYGHHKDVTNVVALNGRGVVAMQQYRYADADLLIKEAVGMSGALLGMEHPRTIEGMLNLAQLKVFQNELVEAEQILGSLDDLLLDVLPSDHDLVGDLYTLQGDLSTEQGDVGSAEVDYRKALAIYQAKFSADHPKVLKALRVLQQFN